jgi:hypothetical protein
MRPEITWWYHLFATILSRMEWGILEMEALQHFSAMEAFCRQRAKMDGEDNRFWLTEAEMLAKLAADAEKSALQCSRSKSERRG